MTAQAHQPILPSIGTIYPGIKASRERGRARLRRYLVLVALHEMRANEVLPQKRTYEVVKAKTREVFQRHFTTDKRFNGVPERTMRDDLVCRRLYRTARGLRPALRTPVDPSIGTMSLKQLQHAYALLEAQNARLEARLQRQMDAAAIKAVGNMLLAANVTVNDAARDADDDDHPGEMDFDDDEI